MSETNRNALTVAELTLPELAAEIQTHHDACREAVGAALTHAMAAGDGLLEAKAKCRHGEWLPWLAANFEFADRTASTYMRLANNREAIESNRKGSADLSIEGAVKLLAKPRPTQDDEPDFDLVMAAINEVIELDTQAEERDCTVIYHAECDTAHSLARQLTDEYSDYLIRRSSDDRATEDECLKRIEQSTKIVNAWQLSKLYLIRRVGQLLAEQEANA